MYAFMRPPPPPPPAYARLRAHTQTGWIEGFAILMAVLAVTLVSSINDYQKEKQFRKLNAVKEDAKVNVLRDGVIVQISKYDIVVGDIVVLAQVGFLFEYWKAQSRAYGCTSTCAVCV